jgi:hypothetical protein
MLLLLLWCCIAGDDWVDWVGLSVHHLAAVLLTCVKPICHMLLLPVLLPPLLL